MSPIINPFYIYLIEILDPLHGFLHALLFITIIGTIGCTLYYFFTKDTTDEYHTFRTEQGKIQRTMKDHAYDLKYKFDSTLEDLKSKKFEDKDIENKIKDLQIRAEECCGALKSVDRRMTSLSSKFDDYSSILAKCKKWGWRCFISSLIVGFINMILPTTETGYKIFLAYQITPENLNLMKDSSQAAIEWMITSIVNAIQDMR